MNPFLVFLLGFLLPVAVAVVLYFTVLKKKICTGDLQHCPSADVDICVKSGTADATWQKMCSALTPGGIIPHNLKEDNPIWIAQSMSNTCGHTIDKDSVPVNCVLALSEFEKTLQGSPLFGTSQTESDAGQENWCLGGGGTPNVTIPSDIQTGSCGNLKANQCAAYTCAGGDKTCSGPSQSCIDAIYSSTDNLCMKGVANCKASGTSPKDCVKNMCSI